MIPKEVVDNIVESAQIEDVVGDFVNLKKRGVNYIGLCPFHNEKTPSFTVSPTKGIFKCFGCGKGGDSVNFLMEHEHYNYPEALKVLAKKYGIEIPEEEITDEQKAEYSKKESMYIVLEFAQKYYREVFEKKEEGKLIAQSYVKERGISSESVEEFSLGFSPKSWDTFTQHAIDSGYQKEYLVSAGLSIERDNGSLIDRFRERLMFPIHSISGRTIGFGARTLKKDAKKEPKYLNSPDSEVYNKSEVLYGLFQAKKAIKQDDLCFLVEGYTDVIALHQKGIKNVVASSGTSLTEGHLRLVKRYTQNICFLFDGDQAGIKASLRAIDLALEEGLNVQALSLPEGEDPDSYSKAHDTQEVKDYLASERKDFIIFKTELLRPEAENDPIKKSEFITEVVRSVALVPDKLKRTIYIQECAKLLRIEEEVLLAELNKQLATILKRKERDLKRQEQSPEIPADIEAQFAEASQADEQPSIQKEEDFVEHQEEVLIKFLLHFGHLMYLEEDMETVAEHIFNFIEEFDIEPENEVLKEIFKEYRNHLENWGVADVKQFYHHDDERIKQMAISLSEEQFEASKNWAKKIGMEVKPEEDYKITLRNIISRYKISRLKKLINQIQEEIREQSENEGIDVLLRTYNKLLMERKQVAKDLGTVIF